MQETKYHLIITVKIYKISQIEKGFKIGNLYVGKGRIQSILVPAYMKDKQPSSYLLLWYDDSHKYDTIILEQKKMLELF